MNRSSYYKWLKRKDAVNEEDKWIRDTILNFQDIFNGILGYRRMTLFINRTYELTYNIKRIRRHMRALGVSSSIRRKKKNYLSYKPEQVGENILNREFTASKPNEKWLTDVTEYKIIGTTKKLYLSAILDLYDNSIIAYRMGTSNNNNLVFKTFDDAIKAHPDCEQILFHSDRGFQYTNRIFKKKLDNANFRQSMSRVGRCIDNGPMEAFWGVMEVEMYKLNEFRSIEQLKMAIEEYITFYNNHRYQPVLKGLTPMELRNQALDVIQY
jgi:transposase InsO family protein